MKKRGLCYAMLCFSSLFILFFLTSCRFNPQISTITQLSLDGEWMVEKTKYDEAHDLRLIFDSDKGVLYNDEMVYLLQIDRIKKTLSVYDKNNQPIRNLTYQLKNQRLLLVDQGEKISFKKDPYLERIPYLNGRWEAFTKKGRIRFFIHDDTVEFINEHTRFKGQLDQHKKQMIIQKKELTYDLLYNKLIVKENNQLFILQRVR